MFASKDLFFSKPSGYQISRSVRTRSSASGNFTRTPASATNRTVWTWSGWVKRGSLPGTWQVLLSSWVDGNNVSAIGFNASNQLEIYNFVGATYTSRLITNAVYRDSSAWYHVVVSSNGSSALNLYVNGVQVTSFATTVGPAATNWFFNSTNLHQLGTTTAGGVAYYLDGYLTEVNFIDGQALTPSSFGQTNTITGVWQPLKYTGTYGTNGFYLNFSDNSNNTATTIGKDYSGNGNNWTPNNISVTAGATYDSMLDVPTLFADGGNGRGNYATLNAVDTATTSTLSNGNLTNTLSGATGASQASTISVTSGKWYWEVTESAVTNQACAIGILRANLVPVATTVNPSGVYYNSANGNKILDGVSTAYGTAWGSTGTTYVIGIALDADAGTVTFYLNNTSQGAITLPANTNGWKANGGWGSATGTGTLNYNFGQRPFTYTPPTGFVALNTQNLPTPTISNGANYMAATTYTGTGSALTVSNAVNGISFQPDFVWVKGRSGATDHALYDSVRGVQKQVESNTTTAETTETTGLTAFGSTGFTVGALAQMNTNAATYVGWQWKAGTTSSSNTAGSITSTVSVGSTQGFSLVTYTGNGTNGATFGHGLGVAPSMVIGRCRSTTEDWPVYHVSLSAGNNLRLNSTQAQFTYSSTTSGGIASASSTIVTTGQGATTNGSMNASGATYVAYCFSEVAGYSKFGSYTGNGSADGPFVFCGFRPRFILWKRTDAVSDWGVIDTARDTYNTTGYDLGPNSSAAEGTGYTVDFLSNGFKIRLTATRINASAGTYIFAAFAEVPLKFSLGR
jgi:hypothetical protein